MSVCLLHVHIWKFCFPAYLRLLVKKRIASICIPVDFCLSVCCFLHFEILFFRFFSLFKQPTVHSGGISMGMVCGCCYWHYWQVTGDRWQDTRTAPVMKPIRWQVTPGTKIWHIKKKIKIVFPFCLFRYLCYNPPTLRDSVSPVCSIFCVQKAEFHLRLDFAYCIGLMALNILSETFCE